MRAMHATAAAIVAHHLQQGQHHPLSSGPLFDQLNLQQAPAQFTLQDAVKQGLSVRPLYAVKVTEAQRTDIKLALDAVTAEEIPRNRRWLLQQVASRVPGTVTPRQVLSVLRESQDLVEFDTPAGSDDDSD
jgi:hypothetical protein